MIFRVPNSKNKLDLKTHHLVIEQSVKAKNPHLTIEKVKFDMKNIFFFLNLNENHSKALENQPSFSKKM